MRRGIGDDLAAGEDDDAVADALDGFEHVRDVEDGFAFAREQDEEVFEEACGDCVQARERLVEDDQPGVMQQGSGDEDALLHALRVVGERGVLGGFEGQELQQGAGFALDELLRHSTQATDELQVLEAGEMGVDLCWVR